jgi:hypothetical protein
MLPLRIAYKPLLHSISTGDASAVVIKYAPGVCWVENGCDVAAGAAYEEYSRNDVSLTPEFATTNVIAS